jgi:hypothetical protein
VAAVGGEFDQAVVLALVGDVGESVADCPLVAAVAS